MDHDHEAEGSQTLAYIRTTHQPLDFKHHCRHESPHQSWETYFTKLIYYVLLFTYI